MPLNWQTHQVPLAGGLDNKRDPRALEIPALSELKNAIFTEIGGLQLRRPYTAYSTTVSGGTTLADIRAIVPYGNELICFTKDALYTWSPAAAAWVSRGTHLATAVTERTVFARSGDQTLCDRAELSSVVVYAWSEKLGTGEEIYVAAVDKTTGGVLLSPTSMGADTSRPRLVALTNRILLLGYDKANSDLLVKAINVSSLSSSVAAGWTTIAATEYDQYYDVTALTSTSAIVVWRRTTTTSYGYATITETPTVSASTKARPCVGPIAVAVTANGANVAVIRAATSTTVVGDSLNSSLVDVAVNAAVGSVTSTLTHIGAAFRSVQNSGVYRCYVWWPGEQGVTYAPFPLRVNYMTTAGVVGTASIIARDLTLASRPFDHDGSVYAWLVFGGNTVTLGGDPSGPNVQNTHFLYRDDGTLIAKATPAVAGGFPAVSGHLPGVASVGTNTYAFCGCERRVIPLGGTGTEYADRGPRDIIVEFDTNEARRCAMLGRTLYVTGGQVQQFDGESLVEVGFHIAPWNFDLQGSGAGNIEPGTYSYKITYSWENAKGEFERSWSATTEETTISSTGDKTILISFLYATKKLTPRKAPAVELWRTKANAGFQAPYYLASSKDPTSSGDNAYIPNDPTDDQITYTEDYPDTTLENKEVNPENEGVLENLAPPPATIIAAHGERVFLAGISADPLAVWYSKLRGEDEVAAFHDGNVVRLPTSPSSGASEITALGFVADTLVVFTGSSIYALPGDGFDNLGTGQNYGPPQLISTDIGATSADLVATTTNGLFFFSNKGWYTLDRGFALNYVGAQIEDYNSDTWKSVHVLEDDHQIRCLSSARLMIFDTLLQQWSEHEIASGVGACVYGGTYHYATSTAIRSEDAAHGNTTSYSLIAEIPWVKLAGLQGFQRIRRLEILGEYRSACDLLIELFRNYDETTPFQTERWTAGPATVGGPIRVRVGLASQKLESLKVRITTLGVASGSPQTGEGVKLTAISFEIGIKRGLARLPAAQNT